MSSFNFKKKYGQNFLKNDNISNKIADSIEPTSNDLIIEIGPGAGAITEKLKKYNCQLIAFEIDQETHKYLDKLEDDKTKIIYSDFLEVDLKQILNDYIYDKLYIIGNLPYYITTPIIEKIIDSKINPESITIMVQKEVGDRFLASPHTKEYGYITVLLNYWYDMKKIVDVDKIDFYPIPKVDSVVLKLSKKDSREVDYNKFKKILKEAFQFKRKTIGNNITSIDKNVLLEVLQKHNYTLQSRAEELDLETFIDMSIL